MLLFSGCLKNSSSVEINLYSSKNLYPIVVLDVPKKAYFDDFIEFDASKSYDPDGEIVTYYWDFGDGETLEGNKVRHSYSFENDFKINYPLIYTYSLFIIDDKAAKIVRSSEIMIYPNKYQFFLISGNLKLEKPYISEDFIKTSLGIKELNPSEENIYKLKVPINMSECSWNVTICLKKPFFARLSKIKIFLYDSNNNEISRAEKKFRFFRFWNKKTIELNGKILTNSEFQYIKLFFYGFSLRNRIKILYGTEIASNICFYFKN